MIWMTPFRGISARFTGRAEAVAIERVEPARHLVTFVLARARGPLGQRAIVTMEAFEARKLAAELLAAADVAEPYPKGVAV